jgi:hypothetical protein
MGGRPIELDEARRIVLASAAIDVLEPSSGEP